MDTGNFIINQRAQQYYWSGECFLSIKSFYNGESTYQVKHRDYRINDSRFLILNECTKYQLTIDSNSEVESFCVFFSPSFVSGFISELNTPEDKLLDFNISKTSGVRLFEKTHLHQGRISEILNYGHQRPSLGMSALEKDEFYYSLLNEIIKLHTKEIKLSNKFGFKKKSTRTEVYQRVLYVKDFIDSNYKSSLRLNELARVGTLSETHLLRSFKQIFGMSPFQYISLKRINEAKAQILTSDKAIKDIAFDVGYTSDTNFSSYFKRIVGLSPSNYRKR